MKVELGAPALARPQWAGWLLPSTLVVLAVNLFPLIGVALWGWDAFLLLILYWAETLIVAFWTIVQIASSPAGTAGEVTVNGRRKVGHPLAVAGFFTVHSGMFIGVHFVFLWVMFSGDWSKRAGGLFGFLQHALGAEGLWLPLAALFIVRGAFALADLLPAWLMPRPRANPSELQPAAARKADMDATLMGLYGRIFAMQIAIIFGGWLAMTVGTMAPLILLVLCKTAAELLLHLGFVPKIERPDGG
jgi:hypothetical protein